MHKQEDIAQRQFSGPTAEYQDTWSIGMPNKVQDTEMSEVKVGTPVILWSAGLVRRSVTERPSSTASEFPGSI